MNNTVIALIIGLYAASGATIYVLGRKINKLTAATQILKYTVVAVQKSQQELGDSVVNTLEEVNALPGVIANELNKTVLHMSLVGVKVNHK